MQRYVEQLHEPHDDAPVTQGELRRLLQAEKNNLVLTFDLEPPLAEEILDTPTLQGTNHPPLESSMAPEARGKHLMCFMDDLGVHRNNMELGLKEFSKSLSGRAFTWYEEGALHIMDLGRVKQKTGEGLLAFIKRYRDRALQCKETLPEADLVYGCIKNIEDGSQIFLSLSGISTFAELIKKGTDVAEAMKRQSKRTKEVDSAYDICALEERGRKRGFKGNHPARKFTPQDIDDTTPSPYQQSAYHNRLLDHQAHLPQASQGWKVLLLEKDNEGGDLHRRPLPNRGVNVITSSHSKLGLSQDAQWEAARALVGIVKSHGGELSSINAPLTRSINKRVESEAGIGGQWVRREYTPTYLLKMLNIPRGRLRASDITLSTFHGEPVESMGCVNAVLECVPSTLHQCIKSNFRGKEIEIQGVKAPFEATASHLIDATLFDELAPQEPRNRPDNGMEKEYMPNGEVRWRIL
ncbi:hypothetical protein SESBI_49500 [Sesbania bispinosa]|nr:hypothetical protein SESBI_49500 [Sesbania bispinosa]